MKIRIGILTKENESIQDSFQSIKDSLLIASWKNNVQPEIYEIFTYSNNYLEQVKEADLLVFPGGWGNKGVEEKLRCLKYARENNKITLGICLGVQLIYIEFARNVLNYQGANSTEFNKDCRFPIVDKIAKILQMNKKVKKQGEVSVSISENSKIGEIYQKESRMERYIHSYVFNNNFIQAFSQQKNVNFSVISNYFGKKTIEAMELKDKRFYLGVQYHPEMISTVEESHPIFDKFIESFIH